MHSLELVYIRYLKFQTVIEYLKKIYALTLFELPSFHTVTASQIYLSYVKFTLNYN